MSWAGSWPTLSLQASRDRLDELRNMLDELPVDPPEVSGHLARFLVVRSTGYVEHTFETCVCHFAEAHSHPAIARHVTAGLFKGRNPRPDVLLDRTRLLSEDWAESLRRYFDEDDSAVRRELSFMVDRRNQIAHGQSESVNRRKALTLADVALDVGKFLTELIDPR